MESTLPSSTSFGVDRGVAKPRLVTPARFAKRDSSSELYNQVVQHNEAMTGNGLKFLRSLLSNLVGVPAFGAVKPLYDTLCGPNPVAAVSQAKAIGSQMYATATEQFVASQISLLVRKYPFASVTDLSKVNGLKVFTDGERRNRHMNALTRARRVEREQRHMGLIGPLLKHSGRPVSFSHHDRMMQSMQRYCAKVLGTFPHIKDWVSDAAWGPGSNIGVTGQFTHLAAKLLAEEWTVTPSALPYALTIAKRLPVFWELLDLTQTYYDSEGNFSHRVICVDTVEFDLRFMRKVKAVDYNKIAFAKKDADKDRVIASEPLLNQLVQKAADERMRHLLRRFGIDLSDQVPNQVYAREGSLGGFNRRCTIDLRNASGSIFTELVRECLALVPDWFVVLNAIRSPAYINPEMGQTDAVRYHMFSSMGNGVTFPLETLIFASICSAAHEYCGTTPDFRCYGDDIIVRQNEALVVLETLRYHGFHANADKTFIYGPFRESCGSDWFDGVDIRPIVLDTSLETLEMRVRLHNAFTRLPNEEMACVLSNACRNWFPSFMSNFVRPFGDHTDEAIDGRFHSSVSRAGGDYCVSTGSPSWYGFSFKPVRDEGIVKHRRYNVALHYAALRGASSADPFVARRETRMRVARFSHPGSTSSWLPEPTTVGFVLRGCWAYDRIPHRII